MVVKRKHYLIQTQYRLTEKTVLCFSRGYKAQVERIEPYIGFASIPSPPSLLKMWKFRIPLNSKDTYISHKNVMTLKSSRTSSGFSEFFS